MLKAWDEEPHVQFSDPKDGGGSGWDWEDQIEAGWAGFEELIAELNGVPFGFVQIMDPERDPFDYWPEKDPGFRAIDLWIGPAEHLGKGYGTQMMRLALARCFAEPSVHTVLIDPLQRNERAIRFYRRIGFSFLETRVFGDDVCDVHRITRDTFQSLYAQRS